MMKKIALIFISIIALEINAQNLAWVKNFGGATSSRVFSNATDLNGNVIIVGDFVGTGDFDPGPGVYNLTSAGGGNINAYVVKLDASGNFMWAKTFGNSNTTNSCYAVKTDNSGNVYLTGRIGYGITDMDPGAGTFTLYATNAPDVFITKLDGNGNFVWARQFDGPNNQDEGCGITLDASGNIYTTGNFYTVTDFDPGPATYTLASGGGAIFVSKLDPAGNFVWAKGFTGGSIASGYSIEVDALGNVYTSGFFSGTTDFDPGAGVYNLYSPNDAVFISKLDPFGNFIWTKQFGQSYSYVKAMKLDAAGNVHTTGTFNGVLDFDPGPGTYTLQSNGIHDIFVSKLDASGNFVWANSFGGIGWDYGMGIDIDALGNVYSTGYFSDAVDFDPGPGTFSLTAGNSSGDDTYISKLNSSGNFVWAKQLGLSASGGVESQSMVIDGKGFIYIAGGFGGPSDFDPGPGTYTINSSPGGGSFMLKLACSQPILSTSASQNTICAGQTVTLTSNGANVYNWNPGGSVGSNITLFPGSSTVYTVTGTDINGCSNTNTVSVTVNALPPIYTSSSTTLVCIGETATLTASGVSSYTWNTGSNSSTITISPTATTIYTVMGTGSNGCVGGALISQSVSACIGIKELSENNSVVTVYPNPNSGVFNVRVDNFENCSIEIYNVIGELILKEKIMSTETNVDIKEFSAGVYQIRLSKEGQVQSGGKVIKE
jgi:hypothetical protein